MSPRSVAPFLLCVGLMMCLSSSVFAQAEPENAQAEPENAQAEPENAQAEPEKESLELDPIYQQAQYDVGNLDVPLNIGFGGFLYLYGGAGVEVGLVPISDSMTLGIGGNFDAGYCVLCGLVGVLSDGDFSLSIWNLMPTGRVMLHFKNLAMDGSSPIDLYGGLGLGASYYSIGVTADGGGKASSSTTALLVAPTFGGRVFLESFGSLFVFAELQYRLEIGDNKLTVEFENSQESFEFDSSYMGGGFDITGGIGFRM